MSQIDSYKHFIKHLKQFTEKLLHGDYSERIDDNYDDITLRKAAYNINRISELLQIEGKSYSLAEESLIDRFIEIIASFTTYDFSRKLEISDKGTVLDAIAAGINMMGEEFEETAAKKEDLEIQKANLEIIKSELLKSTELQKIIIELSTSFINAPIEIVDEKINESLKAVARFLAMDRAYIFEINYEDKVINNTYEYCKIGIGKKIDIYKNLPFSICENIITNISAGDYYNIPDVNELPDDSSCKVFLKQKDAVSMIVYPMMINEKCEGFVGFDSNLKSISWDERESSLLLIFAELLSNVIHRNRIAKSLREGEIKYQTLFNSTNEAFMILEDGLFIDCNSATLDLFGCPNKTDFLRKHPSKLSPNKQPCGTTSLKLSNLKIQEAIQEGSARFEWNHKRYDTNNTFPAEVLLNSFKSGNKNYLQAVVRDISAQKRKEILNKLTSEILLILNSQYGLQETLDEIIKKIKEFLKIEEVGLSLIEDGYSDKYCKYIIEDKNNNSPLLIDVNKSVKKLRCFCGYVLSDTKSDIGLLNKHGSFWSNDLSSLMEKKNIRKNIYRPLKHCINNGINSIALIPIIGDGEKIGLLSLNSKLKDQFSTDLINNLETVSSNIGIALMRKKIAENLEFQYKFQKLVSESSNLFMISDNIVLDKHINDRLRKIGEFFDLDRTYIYLFKDDDKYMENTHEWLADNISFSIERLKIYSLDKFPWLYKQILKGKPYYISNVKSLPTSARKFKEILLKQKTISVLLLPLQFKNKVMGFLGFDVIKRNIIFSEQNISLLNVMAELISAALTRKKIEEDLKISKNEAEKANYAKTEFLSNMSHEIRTPLNSIINFSQILNEEEMPPVNKEYINLINTSAKSLLKIISDILDFNRIESGSIETQQKWINLSNLIKSSIDIVKHSAINKNIELLINCSNKTPKYIYTDSVLVSQVLVNLLSNAIKFTEKGEVELSVLFNEKPNTNNGFFTFEIRDQGIGIDADSLQKIFKPFSQADSSITRKFGGTGLGLSISYNIATQLDGNISVKSVKGKGSVFTLTIPVKFKAFNSFAFKKPGSVNKALIIDDNRRNANILKRTLELSQISVKVKHSCTGAIDILKKENDFDIILVDYDMPKTNGIETIKRIQELQNYNEKTVFILMSNVINEAYISKIKDSGKKMYQISKPILPVNLFNDLNSLNDSNKSESSSKPQVTEKDNKRVNIDKQLKILLVEDVDVNMKVFMIMLQKVIENAIIHTATNGKQAIKVFKDNRPDMIFMDIQMPIMDGLTATQKIREFEEKNGFKRTPIVAVTAHATSGYREFCIKSGTDDYITKPIDPNNLERKIVKYLGISDNDESRFAEPKSEENSSLVNNNVESFNIDAYKIVYGDDSEYMAELFSLFFEELDSFFTEVNLALKNKDNTKLKFHSHSLKGSALQMNFDKISKIAKELETTNVEDTDKIRSLLEDISSEKQYLNDNYVEKF
jgi:signal transduction histidine kinase/CheY-like chemotaxis protein/PAS domain-containing protein